jgi:hypothetical protein
MRLLVLAGLAVLPLTANGFLAPEAQPVALILAIDAAGWRFADAERALPPVQLVQDDPLEEEDWVENAYDGGALRVYASRGGGDIIAVLADTTRPPHEAFIRLGATERYDVQIGEPHVIVVPIRRVDRELFERLKSRDWTESELLKLLGPPSYHPHVHGQGTRFLEYVPEGLSFADNPAPAWSCGDVPPRQLAGSGT